MQEQREAMPENMSGQLTWKYPTVYALIVWAAFLAMHGYYFLLDVRNAPHPSYVPLFSFIAVQVLALLLAVVFGIWWLFRGPKRLETIAWLLLGLLPAFIWYSQVSLTFQCFEERQTRQVEPNCYLLMSQTIAAALFDGIGRWTLPYRLDGERVVMFHDGTIADPKDDLEKMDTYIKKEEKYLGAAMPAKIHWMRAPLLGIPGVALNWVSVAQTNQYDDQKSIAELDYHEAAHNIISSPSATAIYTDHYPPTFIMEGWAQTRSTSWEQLAGECWVLKQSYRALTLREAVSDVYYNQSDGRIYQQGGAFVTVLLDKFGPEKFRELYLNCTRKTFEKDVERVYRTTLEDLDKLYWQEIEKWHASKFSFEKATENCSPEEKALLDEFRQAYERQIEAFYRWTDNGTLEAIVRTSNLRADGEAIGMTELLFRAKDGVLFRFHKKSTGSGTSLDNKTGERKKTDSERIDCHLLTPDEEISTFQYLSKEKDSRRENSWRFEIPPSERKFKQESFRRHALATFRPLSLFFTGYGHTFTSPVEYLWEPPIGTIVQIVVEKDGIVELTLKTPEPAPEVLTLHLDRRRDWLLLEATSRKTRNGKTWEDIDVREYGESVDGMPLLMKRSVRRVPSETGYGGYHSSEEIELIRFDPSPVDSAVFLEKNLPLDVQAKEKAKRIPSEQRLQRHLGIIAVWLFLPGMILFWTKRKEKRIDSLPKTIPVRISRETTC